MRYDDKEYRRVCYICDEVFDESYCSFSMWKYREKKARAVALDRALNHLAKEHGIMPEQKYIREYVYLKFAARYQLVKDIFNTPAILLIMFHDVIAFVLDKTIFKDSEI